MNNTQYYLDTFGTSERELERVTSAALSRGGDYCDLYFEYTTYFNLLLRDGVVSSGGFHTDYGVGIRVLKGEKTGYAYAENTDARQTGCPAGLEQGEHQMKSGRDPGGLQPSLLPQRLLRGPCSKPASSGPALFTRCCTPHSRA